jgi:hypothetical protein
MRFVVSEIGTIGSIEGDTKYQFGGSGTGAASVLAGLNFDGGGPLKMAGLIENDHFGAVASITAPGSIFAQGPGGGGGFSGVGAAACCRKSMLIRRRSARHAEQFRCVESRRPAAARRRPVDCSPSVSPAIRRTESARKPVSAGVTAVFYAPGGPCVQATSNAAERSQTRPCAWRATSAGFRGRWLGSR